MSRPMLFMTLLVPLLALRVAHATPSIESAVMPPAAPWYDAGVYAVTVEAAATARYEFPDLAAAAGRVEIKKGEQITEPVDGGRVRRTQQYQVDPIFPGVYLLPPVSITWRDEEEEGVLIAPALAYHARELTDVEEEAVQQFIGLTDADQVLSPGPVSLWSPLVAGVLALAGVAALLLVLRRLRRGGAESGAAALPPWETALNRLRELEQRDLPGAGKLEIYYVDLSSILRYYIEDRFHIHAPEQTTPEFIQAAAQYGGFTEAQQHFLSEFLRYCDRIKYARFEPALEDARRHFKEVRLFVKETIPEEVEHQAMEQAA